MMYKYVERKYAKHNVTILVILFLVNIKIIMLIVNVKSKC